MEDTLLGFGDFFQESLGQQKKPGAKPAPGKPGAKPAVKPKLPPKKVSASERGIYRAAGKPNTDVKKHAGALKKGAVALQKAANVAARGKKSFAKAAQTAKALAKPAPGKKPTVVKGKSIMGQYLYVGGPTAAKMTPKAQLAVKRHNDAVKKSREASKKLAKGLLKTRATARTLAKQMVAQRNQMKQIRSGKKIARLGDFLNHPFLGEEVAEALIGYYDAVGADPDPENPGFLTDGSPDPAYDFSDIPEEGPAGLTAMDILNAAAELGPAPAMDQQEPDSTLPTVPAIPYDGSKGMPDGFVVSYGMTAQRKESGVHERAAGGQTLYLTDKVVDIKNPGIDPAEHYGYVFGKYGGDPPKGLPWGEDFTSGKWIHVHGRHSIGGWHGGWDEVSDQEAFASNNQKNPDGASYGPLVGNPNMPAFARMRVDGKGRMFWYAQEAPEWLTAPIRMAAKLTEIAAKKAEEDAAKADALAIDKERKDNEAAMRAQEASNALAESAAASGARVTTQEETAKQMQTETLAQQALVQQQQQETTSKAAEAEQLRAADALALETAKAEMEQLRQADLMLLEQAKRQQAYMAQHPEVEFAPPAPAEGEGEGEEEGAEEGYSEEEYAEDYGEEGEAISADYSDEGGYEGGDEAVGYTLDVGEEDLGYTLDVGEDDLGDEDLGYTLDVGQDD